MISLGLSLHIQPDNTSSPAIVALSNASLTALWTWNYTYYPFNSTLSNDTKCHILLSSAQLEAQGLPQLAFYPNGSVLNSTSCFTPFNPILTQGILGTVFGILFALLIIPTMVNLNLHGRSSYASVQDRRFKSLYRRMPWYWMLLLAGLGSLGGFIAIDIDRDYLPSMAIVLRSIFHTVQTPAMLACVWESTRQWTSFQRRLLDAQVRAGWSSVFASPSQHFSKPMQSEGTAATSVAELSKRSDEIVQPLPFLLPTRIEPFYLPFVFYVLLSVSFALTTLRSWGALQLQASPEQIEIYARPTATNWRFKTGSILDTAALLPILLKLYYGLRAERTVKNQTRLVIDPHADRLPRRRSPPPISASTFRTPAAPSSKRKSMLSREGRGRVETAGRGNRDLNIRLFALILAVILVIVRSSYSLLSSFTWRISALNISSHPGWLYGVGTAPVFLLLLTQNVSALCYENEEIQILKTRKGQDRLLNADGSCAATVQRSAAGKRGDGREGGEPTWWRRPREKQPVRHDGLNFEMTGISALKSRTGPAAAEDDDDEGGGGRGKRSSRSRWWKFSRNSDSDENEDEDQDEDEDDRGVSDSEDGNDNGNGKGSGRGKNSVATATARTASSNVYARKMISKSRRVGDGPSLRTRKSTETFDSRIEFEEPVKIRSMLDVA